MLFGADGDAAALEPRLGTIAVPDAPLTWAFRTPHASRMLAASRWRVAVGDARRPIDSLRAGWGSPCSPAAGHEESTGSCLVGRCVTALVVCSRRSIVLRGGPRDLG